MKRSLVLIPLLALLLTGCLSTYGQGTHYPDRRHPDDRRHRDTRVDHYHQRIHGDVSQYVTGLDRNLRLTSRQEQRISRLLSERTYRLLDRSRNDRNLYPFPRQHDRRMSRGLEVWWGDVDRDIERYLDRRQREEYRYLTRRYDERYERRGDRYGKNHGSHRGRGKKRGHHDQ